LEILDGINLQIPDGESVALVGPSEAGKTSLVETLVGFTPLCDGKIFIGDSEVTFDNIKNIREKISFFSHSPIIFNTSIFENITYGS